MKALFIEETKRNFILDRLKELNITKTNTGKNVHDLSYSELKEQLVLASFREIDTQNENNAWF